jgi:hypothetical protein
VTFDELVYDMVHADVENAVRDDVLRAEGYVIREPRE